MFENTIARVKEEARVLFGPTKLGPSYPRLPETDEHGETNISGLYVLGDAAGTPLLKLGLNAGYEWMEHVAPEIEANRDKGEVEYDVIIVGCGATGFAAANRAHERGMSYLVIESGQFCDLIQSFTKGKPLFNEPHDVEQKGSIWFEECSKEELLQRWEEKRRKINLNLHEYEKVVDVRGRRGHFTVFTDRDEYTAAMVLLAVGKAGNPRKANVPGEEEYSSRIHHYLADPDVYHGKNILIYGAGDVAAEAALALCEDNNVTLATVDSSFVFPKKRNIDALQEQQEKGNITVRFNTELREIGESKIVLRDQSSGESFEVDNDVVFEMIGSIPPISFFKNLGIRIANTWTGNPWIAGVIALLSFGCLSLWGYATGMDWDTAWRVSSGLAFLSGLGLLIYLGTQRNRWAWLGFTVLIAYSLFAAKGSTARFPFHWIGSEEIAAFLSSGILGWFVPKAVLALKGAPSFWYTLLYTFLVVFFGIKAMRRWGYRHDDNHQKMRYISIMAFQIVFFIVVNMLLSVLIGKYYWRGWGLYQPFPLFYNTFFWWYPGDPASIKWFFIGFGFLLTFVAIPVFVRYHGLRFCTWVCGCGGLAETLGDRWRHLSPKGLKSRKWEIMGPAVMFWAFTSLFVIVFAFNTRGNTVVWQSYDYFVDFWLVAVIPIGLYPFFGGKVWCRYWCPLVHYMKFLSSWYGKLRIVSNEKCISCTQCSKYCQVGVDVMAFAKNQEPFDNTNSSCIHCGICITVCPVDVLSFDTQEKPLKEGKPVFMPEEDVRLV